MTSYKRRLLAAIGAWPSLCPSDALLRIRLTPMPRRLQQQSGRRTGGPSKRRDRLVLTSRYPAIYETPGGKKSAPTGFNTLIPRTFARSSRRDADRTPNNCATAYYTNRDPRRERLLIIQPLSRTRCRGRNWRPRPPMG